MNIKRFKILGVDAAGYVPDLGFDDEGWERLDLWKPPDPDMICIELTIALGMEGMTGSNFFSLEIVTRRYIDEKGWRSKPKFTLVVDKFDWATIKSQVKKRLSTCLRETWDASVEELRKKFFWEYETESPTLKEPEPLPKDFFRRRSFRKKLH